MAPFLAGLAGLVIGGGAIALWIGREGGDAAGPGRAAIEKVVHDYVLAHPEIIPEAMQRLQDGERARAVAAHRAQLETPFFGAWAGAGNGDVVLVEFFDYACGYCRRSNADVDRLLREDDRLKVVWREWPVLGPDSETAAAISLAAAKAGRFRAFHDTLFALGRPTPATIAQAQRAAGISPQQVAEVRGSGAAADQLRLNYELARAMNASGTPTFIVGDKVLQGAVGYAALRQAVTEARERG